MVCLAHLAHSRLNYRHDSSAAETPQYEYEVQPANGNMDGARVSITLLKETFLGEGGDHICSKHGFETHTVPTRQSWKGS